MSSLLHALIILPFCMPLFTQAHVQMSWPYPLRSPLDLSVPEQYRDYSMTNPLKSDFSCKHYQYNDTNPQAYNIKATYQAGNTYNLTLSGTATHSGGSCQISISYDNGATFKVIQSIIGGCPLTPFYDFTIPIYAPSSESALLSWTWFNLVGNREMYQNCARVQIQRAPSQRYRRTAYRRQSSMDQLPDLFACNIGNGCQTIENAEVVFPYPGPNVIYGQDAITPNPGPGFVTTGSNPASTIAAPTSPASASTTTTSGPSIVNNNTLAVELTGTGLPNLTNTSLDISMNSTFTAITSIAPSTSSMASTMAQQSEPVGVTVIFTVTPSVSPPTITLSTIVSIIPTTSVNISSPTSLLARDTTTISGTIFPTVTVAAPSSTSSSLSLPCTPGTFACNSLSTFSQCVSSGTYVHMGSVAAGMQCMNGQITRQNAGPCTPNGQIFCKGSNNFYQCDQGGLVNMGPVAPGTVCWNGVLVSA